MSSAGHYTDFGTYTDDEKQPKLAELTAEFERKVEEGIKLVSMIEDLEDQLKNAKRERRLWEESISSVRKQIDEMLNKWSRA